MTNSIQTSSQINFIEKDQDWANETTRYWFSVNGENYCMADNNGSVSLLDSEGYPIDDCNDHSNIKDLLTHHYQKHVMDH
ncbi:hypothetical protein KAR91_12885 [Candidatus Pacearchaeota archaeon]|nr:hypothetical protein [Candidatus Pacearchaeota archaeon]